MTAQFHMLQNNTAALASPPCSIIMQAAGQWQDEPGVDGLCHECQPLWVSSTYMVVGPKTAWDRSRCWNTLRHSYKYPQMVRRPGQRCRNTRALARDSATSRTSRGAWMTSLLACSMVMVVVRWDTAAVVVSALTASWDMMQHNMMQG